MAKAPLSRREREILDILYRLGRASAHDVLAAMPDPPSYSAVRAHLRLLEERGHAKHVEEGGRYVYAPQVPRGEARKKALSHLVSTFFGGSVEDAVLALVETSRDKLGPDELERLAAAVARAKKGSP
ncbi:MAG: BlaI/MecI/CopY family transcriptional regulator [Polyangiaceae bacterium]